MQNQNMPSPMLGSEEALQSNRLLPAIFLTMRPWQRAKE